MKFGTIGQIGPVAKITLVSAIALVVATLFTACSSTLTVGFMFVATNKQTPGQIEVYEINSQSGVLRTIPTSPFPSGGRDPIAEAVSTDSKNLYVANEDDNNVVQFGIGTDGKLYSQSTVNTPGSFPLAIAVKADDSYLFGVDTLQPIAGCSLSNACPGDVFVCPITASGSLGTPVNGTNQCLNYYPLQLTASDSTTVLTPTALNVLPNGQYLYVTAYNAHVSPNIGYVFAFAVNGDGTLTALPLGQGGQIPLALGAEPVAMASDSGNAYLYVVDKLKNQIATLAVQSTGALAVQSTTGTGNQPSSVTASGTGFLYVANSLDSTLTGYTISSGNLTSFGTYATDDNPIAVVGDPRKLGFLYTVNFLGSSLSGYQVDTASGALINTKQSPYASSVQPTAIAGIPHGGSTH
jgi:6-phosphogluconolactonase